MQLRRCKCYNAASALAQMRSQMPVGLAFHSAKPAELRANRGRRRRVVAAVQQFLGFCSFPDSIGLSLLSLRQIDLAQALKQEFMAGNRLECFRVAARFAIRLNA